MEIIWTRHALGMIDDIFDYIAHDHFPNAEKWALNLINQTDKLIEHPKLGRVVPEFNQESIREIIAGNYRIIYRIREDRIYIEAIWHTRKLPPDIE